MSTWNIGTTTNTLHTPIWDVVLTEKTSPEGKVGKFASLKAPDWCKAVIYNSDTDRYILVREYRHGIDRCVYEFPSGTVEVGEDPRDAVVREVREETGYVDISIEKVLFSGCPNPAFMNNTMTCYFVKVSGKPGETDFDDFEDLSTVEVSPSEIGKYITEDSALLDQFAKSLIY